MTIRVLIADDDPLARGGLEMFLGAQRDVEVVGEAADGGEAVALARSLAPDVVLMDVKMPGADGIAATAELTSDAFTGDADALVKVLVLTSADVCDRVTEALRAGASGFVLKTSVPSDLVPAIRAVAVGDSWLDHAVAGRVIAEALSARPAVAADPCRFARLTAREREVYRLVAAGLSNTDIAGRLVLSEKTVRTHVSRVLMKLEARDRAQAVALAYRGGFLTPDEGP